MNGMLRGREEFTNVTSSLFLSKSPGDSSRERRYPALNFRPKAKQAPLARVPAPVLIKSSLAQLQTLRPEIPNMNVRCYALAATAGSAAALFDSSFDAGCPPLRMSIPPLKKAPSSIEIRAATTSPVSEPSLRMSTRSLAVRLPRTLPRTTISRALMLADTTPLRPTVTRLPERLMEPSTRPSMYSDSDPVTSPLITSDLPMVAWSAVLLLLATGRGAGADDAGSGA